MFDTSLSFRQAPRPQGRPRVAVAASEVKDMYDLGFTIAQMGTRLNISRPTIYKLLADANIDHSSRFVDVTDSQLDGIITDIKATHPNAGEINVMGHLRARNVKAQRKRVRESIHRVDPQGPSMRSSRSFRHRVYSTPCPNYVWHIDGNHKLVKWGFVTHLSIDGFTRLITYGETSDNNTAIAVLQKFLHAVDQYGRPLRVRTDHGGENVRIWQNIVDHYGYDSVIAGTSVLNQRVERLNGDVNIQVNRFYAEIFRELEFEQKLDIINPTDKFCLHYVFLPRINKTLSDFVNAHNCHGISTEGGATPRQLMFAYRHLTELQHLTNHSTPYPSVSVQQLLNNQTGLPFVQVSPPVTMLPDDKFAELRELVDPLAVSTEKGKDLYQRTVQFVGDYLVSQQNV